MWFLPMASLKRGRRYLGLKSKKQRPTEKIFGGRERQMSDLRKYIDGRKKRDSEFASGFDEGYDQFKVGAMLRQARESVGLTQEELARRLKTKKVLYRESKTMPKISNFQPWSGSLRS